MKLIPGVDYDPERVRRFRFWVKVVAQNGVLDSMRDLFGRQRVIDWLREHARDAIYRPPSQPYRIDRVWHPALGRRVDLRDPEARVPEAEVQAWQRRSFERTGLRYPVAACLVYLERNFGGPHTWN